MVQLGVNNFLIVRNGMLFGWFDNNGAPGPLGCPAANEAIQGSDSASGVTWSTQQFQRGMLYWSTGMPKATSISVPALAAIRWAWHCIPSGTCNYNTTNSQGFPTTIPNYYRFCLGFVYNAYTSQGFTPQGGPHNNDALAKQWWTENSIGTKHPGDVNAGPGSFAIWNGADGHIALSIGGGYAVSTYSGGDPTIHIAPIANIESPSIYFGWITPGI